MRRVRAAAVLAALLAFPAACRRPANEARLGDLVRLHYRVFADGRVYDTTEGDAPVQLVIGGGALPAPVEAALIGMRPGEEKSLTVENAYGKPRPENVSKLPRRSFSGLNQKLKPGLKILGVKNGKPAEAMVLAVDSNTVTLSFDHPLAGKTVSFTLQLVSIERR